MTSKAYILLESLIALGLLATITLLLLGQISQGRQRVRQELEQQEVLNVATMAIQTGKEGLQLNGQQVQLVQSGNLLRIKHDGEIVFELIQE